MVTSDRSAPATSAATFDAPDVPGLRGILRRAVLLPMALLGVLAGALLWQVSALIATDEWVDHTDQVITQIQLCDKLMLEMRAGAHGFVFSGDAGQRAAFERARRALETEVVRLLGLISDNPAQVVAVTALTGAIADWRADAQRIVALAPTAKAGDLVPGVRASREALDRLRARAASLIDDEQTLRRARAAASQSRAAWVYRSGIILLIAGGGALVLVGRRQLATLTRLFAQQSRALRQQAESLTRSERNLGTTLDSIGDAVIVTDARARVTRMNPVAEALTGWNSAEAHGQSLDQVFRIINEETRQTVESPSVRVLREGIVVGLANHTALVAKSGLESPIADSGAPIRDETGAVTGLVLVFRDMTADREKEEAVRASARRFRALVQNSADVVMVQHADRTISYVSASCQVVLGHRSADLLGVTPDGFVHPDDRATLESLAGRLMETPGQPLAAQFRMRHQDGSWRWMEGHAVNLLADRDVKGIVTNIRDVTERRSLEDQLLQVQKTEAIGRLAGGIAHDFNNLLTVVIGNCHVLLQDAATAVLRAEIEEIKDAGERAATLTRQLLAFGRRQVLMPELRPLNGLVSEVEKLLRRVLGEQVELGVRLGADAGTIKVDPGQFEQVLLNLAINARDAMPRGGRLTVETQSVELDDEYARQHPGVVPGPYAMVAVSDTGVGMDLDVQSHVFEPFFTTKPKGKGSGLGLATVHGIVRQTRGHIWFYSAVDHGTVFKVYFPRVYQIAGALPPAAPAPAAPSAGRGEAILVIEDDASLRRFTSRILRDLGYAVFEAARGEEALAFLHTNPQRIDLVLTDVIMPGVTGRALEARLLAAAPHLKVVFTSGYTDDAIVHHGVLDEGTHFIQKPFTPAALGNKIRAVLDGEAPARGARRSG